MGKVALGPELSEAREQARSCTRCDLYKMATQTVFGEGPSRARMMLVGEQPGDREDIAGHPFVGPAGGVLDRALRDLRIDRNDVYMTNVVKHFRWERSGKRRIHKTPTTEQVRACLPWFDVELAAVRPAVVVCLGAVAAKALLGQGFRLTNSRGAIVEWDRPGVVLATVHPAAVLRSDDREAAYAAFVNDLAVAANHIETTRIDRPRKEQAMPQRAWSDKRERQYEHIKESLEERGQDEDTAEEIAARTVNKERARHGEAKTSSRLSREDISSGRRGGLRSHSGPGGRTRDQLYEEAKKKNIRGRSKMTKAELERAVGR